MSLALHYWMRDVHQCSGPPSLQWPILCRVGCKATIEYTYIHTCSFNWAIALPWSAVCWLWYAAEWHYAVCSTLQAVRSSSRWVPLPAEDLTKYVQLVQVLCVDKWTSPVSIHFTVQSVDLTDALVHSCLLYTTQRTFRLQWLRVYAGCELIWWWSSSIMYNHCQCLYS